MSKDGGAVEGRSRGTQKKKGSGRNDKHSQAGTTEVGRGTSGPLNKMGGLLKKRKTKPPQFIETRTSKERGDNEFSGDNKKIGSKEEERLIIKKRNR